MRMQHRMHGWGMKFRGSDLSKVALWTEAQSRCMLRFTIMVARFAFRFPPQGPTTGTIVSDPKEDESCPIAMVEFPKRASRSVQ